MKLILLDAISTLCNYAVGKWTYSLLGVGRSLGYEYESNMRFFTQAQAQRFAELAHVLDERTIIDTYRFEER